MIKKYIFCIFAAVMLVRRRLNMVVAIKVSLNVRCGCAARVRRYLNNQGNCNYILESLP
jgi:hypothetical protein